MPTARVSSALMDIDPEIYAKSSTFAEITGMTVPAWAQYDVAKTFLRVTEPGFKLMAAFVQHYRSAPSAAEKERIAKGKAGEC